MYTDKSIFFRFEYGCCLLKYESATTSVKPSMYEGAGCKNATSFSTAGYQNI